MSLSALNNIPDRSLKIIEQWRKKAALHAVPVIFVELGDDFAYGLKEDIEDTYANYKVCTIIFWRIKMGSSWAWGLVLLSYQLKLTAVRLKKGTAQ